MEQGRGRSDRITTFGPLVRVLTAQALSLTVIVAMGFALATLWDLKLSLWSGVVTQSLCATALSYLIGLRRGWLVVQFGLPLAAVGLLTLALPGWVYLAVFLSLTLVYSNVSSERVPLYLSNRTTWAALSEMISTYTDAVDTTTDTPCFIDLGCGLGGTIAYLAKVHPNWRFVGVENAPGPYLISRLRLLRRPNARVEFKSLWDVDLGAFNIVYAFLSPAPMPRLIAQACTEMRPGSLLISNSFWAPDLPFDGEAEVNDGRKTSLFFKKIEKFNSD